ncbi:MAG: polymerase sporulation-specific sigma factor [Bacillota bacterium]|nr:RNA polymerase sporulation sigma factor SigE [Gelria sp. Kuro-4]MDK2926370.1 polymerase sporulation-specific sigma factor [Bacillota bacterium]
MRMKPFSAAGRLAVRLFLIRLLQFLGIERRALWYVGSSEALPPPLTSAEEGYLLERLQRGDKAVKSLLIEHNLRLVVYIARKFENTGVGIEDLVSIGSIGLIKAVNTFNPAKKIKLATYASRCVENEILMFLRRNNKVRSEVSFDEPLNIDWDGNELLLSDVLGTEGDIISRSVEEEVDKKLLHQALQKLSAREKLIMELRFGLKGSPEKTQKEVADLLGISQSYISRLEKRIIKRLRREIKRME